MDLMGTIREYFEEGNKILTHSCSDSIYLRDKKGLIQITRYGIPGKPRPVTLTIRKDLNLEERYITILHEFIHLHCMRYDHRCKNDIVCCIPCPYEDDIEKESKELYKQNSPELKYIKSKLARKPKKKQQSTNIQLELF
jgi:hypothetical protein